MTTKSSRITVAQLSVVRLAATRESRGLEPLPMGLKGAAGQSVIDALVTQKFAVRCYLATHVEYVLTDAGLDAGNRIKRKETSAHKSTLKSNTT